MLDLARGRLAGGIRTTRTMHEDLKSILQQVIDELKTVWPNKRIDVYLSITNPVLVDNARIAQLFSNILGNALKYGTDAQPVRVRVTTTMDTFELSASNAGEKIPPEARELLFKPFSRGTNHDDKPGFGLGLYIADEIARAHNGIITVDSSEDETTFLFSMPV